MNYGNLQTAEATWLFTGDLAPVLPNGNHGFPAHGQLSNTLSKKVKQGIPRFFTG
jgi:hypothetical protein